MNRQEHMAWAKERAYEILRKPENPNAGVDAWTSFVSDLGKHPQTSSHPAIELGTMLRVLGLWRTDGDVCNFIEGFN